MQKFFTLTYLAVYDCTVGMRLLVGSTTPTVCLGYHSTQSLRSINSREFTNGMNVCMYVCMCT